MRLLAAWVVLVAVASAAADVSVEPRLRPGRVVVGQPAALDVEIRGTQNAEVPVVPVPDGLRIEYRGQSTQVSIVNGAMSTSLTHSFLLVPDRAGSYEVGPIRVQAGGRAVDAGSVRLEVTGAAAAPETGGGPPPTAQALGPDGLRLSLAVGKERVYLHERVPLRVTLEVGDVQVTDVRYPVVGGDAFSIGKFAEPEQHQEIRGGRRVQVVDFATDLLPVRAGEATLSATITLAVVVRRGNPLFDHFFGMDPTFGSRRNVTLEAEPVHLVVLPLPEAGRPPSFGGAVGSFTLAASASPLEVRAGDPVTVSITLRGTGNLEHATAPALDGSDALKVYPPSLVEESARGAALEKRFEQVVIPQAPGDVSLPALDFAFFDPDAGVYRTATAPPIALRVLPAPASETPVVVPPPAAAPGARDEVLGRDLVSIKDDPGRLVPVGSRRWRSPVFWLLQLLPPLLWGACVMWDRRRRRLSGDQRYARFTRAGSLARRRFDDARTALQGGDAARFYDALARGMQEYLAAKLDLPPGAVSPATVAEKLHATAVPASLVDEATGLLLLCEQMRFAPIADGDRASALARADALVRGLERQRGLARSLAVAA
ncbi:MAG TPA: BatD family protein, partial [Candidatus Limnocylindria bacterium]|nr:BatD family protein [Candidatus Limnocylindria bacterium]